MRFLVLALLALAASPAGAQTLDCSNANTTVEMNFCADKEYAAADAGLNETYKAALAKIAKSGGERPYDSKSWEAALRASQRAWIAFRDAECKGLVPMQWGGGSGTTLAVLGCMTSLTQARAAMLKEQFEEPEAGADKGPARVP
jgi:uncharacterized protein YecT (DUF1311 family)